MAGKLSSAFLIFFCVRACVNAHSCSLFKRGQFSFTFRNLRCSNVASEVELGQAIKENMDFSPQEFEFSNSALRFIRHDTFRGTHLKIIVIRKTSLMSLTDTNRAFVGLEDSLEWLIVDRCSFVGHWNWEHLRNLKRINLIRVMHSDMDYVQKFPDISPTMITLQSSGITHLAKDAFKDVRKLQTLWLDGNSIAHIERSMFPKPAEHLNDLDLSRNKIRKMPVDIFMDMPFLRYVDLSWNQILTISEKVFRPVWRQLTRLSMEGNGLICDCRVKWIVNEAARENLLVECKHPRNLKGKPLTSLKNNDLWC